MASSKPTSYPILEPNLQISFYYRLKELRSRYLRDAMCQALEKVEMATVNAELAQYVDEKHLKRVAQCGLRGELFFPVPCILTARPFLLGYYRLLFGHSQKEFYNKGPFGRFKCLEEQGEVPLRVSSAVPELCRSLVSTAQGLVGGLDRLSVETVHELQLLTLGPQFRGSENTRLGQVATQELFGLMHDLLNPYVKESTRRTIRIENDSGRTVFIEFSADPDVRITESLESELRPLVSIEIKGGADASNIHNRLGEAEKSHQKSRERGFAECWTIVRVDVNREIAKQESPSTTRLFHLDRILDRAAAEHTLFRDVLASTLGVSLAR